METRRRRRVRGHRKPGTAKTRARARARAAAQVKIPEKYSKPAKPVEWCSDPDKWLDNTNIEAVLRQYEAAYPWFRLLGVYPIDFAAPSPYDRGDSAGGAKCLEPIMCSVTIPELRRDGIRYAAAVFNLDNHLESGSHWVACVINVTKPAVYYFDSYGLEPPSQISTFMKSLANDEPRLLKGNRIGFNGRRFQYGGSECGMYSLYFVISMIQGISFRTFVRRPVADKYMLALRNVLFNDKCGR